MGAVFKSRLFFLFYPGQTTITTILIFRRGKEGDRIRSGRHTIGIDWAGLDRAGFEGDRIGSRRAKHSVQGTDYM